MGHLLIENRSALIVDAELTQATGFAEQDCATTMLARLPARARWGGAPLPPTRTTTPKISLPAFEGCGFTPHVRGQTPATADERSMGAPPATHGHGRVAADP